jgi:lipopolysaccharide/colanic/teichoic acid biosynthesis glycosyltransferase
MIRILSGAVLIRMLTLFISESALLYACYLAAVYLDSGIDDAGIFLLYDSGFLRIAIITIMILLGLYFRDLYEQLRIPSRVLLFQELCMIFGLAFLGQGFISYIHRSWALPRRVMMGGSLLALLCLFGWRLFFGRAARGAVRARRVLFLGITPTVVQLAGHFNGHPEVGFTPVGYLDSEYGAGTGSENIPRLGLVTDLTAVLDQTQPNSVVIGKREDIKPWWTNEFLELRFAGVNAEQAATVYERIFGRVCSAEIWPSRLIFGNTWKVRSIDVTLQTVYSIVIATVVTVAMMPFMILIAALLKLSSPGPVLLREKRIGLHDVPFAMYRFRCSRDAGGSGADTMVGGFLRRWGLDALPRLFNVLRGEMAVVGPHADRLEFANSLTEQIPFYRQRHQVKPGLTGWAQVHYDDDQSEQDVLRRLEYDLYYVKKVSPAFDSFVLLLTVKIALLRR